MNFTEGGESGSRGEEERGEPREEERGERNPKGERKDLRGEESF